jgi:tryptophan synthase
VHVDAIIRENGKEPGLVDQMEALNTDGPVDPAAIPARFGEFGGQYVPESLMDCLSELEEGFNKIKDDPAAVRISHFVTLSY